MTYAKLFCISLFLFAGTSNVFSQQVYNANKYGGIGTVYLYNPVFGLNQDSVILKGGADVTWDLSSHTTLNTHTSSIVSKEDAFDFFTFLTICGLGGTGAFQCINIWNNTDQALLIQDTISLFQFSLIDLQRYQRKSPTGLFENFLGFKADIGGTVTPAVVVYSNPDTILHFPVTYGDSYTSSINWAIDLSAIGQPVAYKSHQTRETSIDAWGDLITPYQTFENVVRMRSAIHRQDTLSTDTLAIPIEITQVEYMWFDTLYKLPVMVANGIITDTTEILGTIEYLYDKTCPAPTWDVSLSTDTYVIDSSGSVTVEFIIDNPNADEYTWDWGDGTYTTTSGSTSHTFSTPGEYVVGITGCMTNCLPLNSCAYDIVEFIVLSNETVPGEAVGIMIFPNPVNESVNMFIPEAIGASSYSVIDMNGRVVMRGQLKPGSNRMEIDAAAGMYTVQVKPESQHVKNDYFVRFIVAE